MKNYEIKTRSGIEPKSFNGEVPFEVSTKRAEAHIQQRISALCKQAKINDIKISLVSTDTETTGSSFRPFLLIMPTAVLDKRRENTRKQNSNRISIFNNVPTEQSGVRLLSPIYSLVNAYSFSKDDIKFFRTYESKKMTKMNNGHIDVINQYRTAKVRKEDNVKYVVVMIDPMRLFNDMSKDAGENSGEYRIVVRRITKLDDLSYNYDFVRIPVGDDKRKPIKLKKLGGLLK